MSRNSVPSLAAGPAPLPPIGDDTLIPPHRATNRDTWVDIGLTLPTYPPTPVIYRKLLEETERLQMTGQASLSFFIHKPPGLRWRLQSAADSSPTRLRQAATESAGRIVGADRVRCAVYEPQQALFGGERSMRFVHRTWSADSLLWMGWHATSPRPSATARWELSFRALAHVFTQLGVVGWEDREVWDCVSQDTGRRLAEHEWTRPEVVAHAGRLRDHWNTAWGAPHKAAESTISEAGLEPLRAFELRAGLAFSDWHAQCLSRPATQHLLTPRKAAAYWTVFHWNRAGLTSAQQALAAQTLAGRPVGTPTQ